MSGSRCVCKVDNCAAKDTEIGHGESRPPHARAPRLTVPRSYSLTISCIKQNNYPLNINKPHCLLTGAIVGICLHSEYFNQCLEIYFFIDCSGNFALNPTCTNVSTQYNLFYFNVLSTINWIIFLP